MARLLIAALAFSLCSHAHAQSKQTALKALGKFATEVLTKLAVDLAKDEIKGRIKPETPAGPNQATSANARATPAWNTAPQPAAPPQPAGYQFRLAWNDPRDPRYGYVGVLQMSGLAGNFLLFRTYAGTPVPPIIQQSMSTAAAPNKRDVILTGSFPRVAGTFQPVDYSPDAFRLTQNAFGSWTVADTCDANVCAPVYVIDATVGYQ